MVVEVVGAGSAGRLWPLATAVAGLGLAVQVRAFSPADSLRATAPAPVWVAAGAARGVPAHDKAAVYFLTRDHHVVAVHPASGVVRWRRSVGPHQEAARGPGVTDAGEAVVAGDYVLSALDKRTGDVRWRFAQPERAAIGIYVGGVVSGLVLTGSATGRINAVHAGNGTLAWSTVVGDEHTTVFWPVATSRVAAAGFTAFGSGHAGGVVAVEAQTGRPIWRSAFPASRHVDTGAAWAGGPVLIGDLALAASRDGRIHAFDARDGSLRWTLPAVRRPPSQFAQADPAADFRPLAANGRRLFAGSMTGVLTAYDVDSRTEVWRYAPRRSGSMGFTIACDDRTVYVPYSTGWLAAVGAEDGVERWRSEQTGGFLWPPAISASLVYASSATGGLHAFRR